MLWDHLRSLLSGAPGMGQGCEHCASAMAQVKDSLQHAQLSAAASCPLWTQNSIPPRMFGTEHCHQLSSGQHFQEPDASRTQASSPSGDLRPPASSLCFLPRASSSPQLPGAPWSPQCQLWPVLCATLCLTPASCLDHSSAWVTPCAGPALGTGDTSRLLPIQDFLFRLMTASRILLGFCFPETCPRLQTLAERKDYG